MCHSTEEQWKIMIKIPITDRWISPLIAVEFWSLARKVHESCFK